MKANHNFLIEHFKETQAQMRHRIDVELRLLQFLLLFFPVVGLIFTTLYGSSVDRTVFLYLCIAAFLFLILVTHLISIQIREGHRTYQALGLSVQKVWKYFDLSVKGAYLENDSVIDEDAIDIGKGYGTGKGYRRTQVTIWTISIVFALFTIALGVLKYLAPLNVNGS